MSHPESRVDVMYLPCVPQPQSCLKVGQVLGFSWYVPNCLGGRGREGPRKVGEVQLARVAAARRFPVRAVVELPVELARVEDGEEGLHPGVVGVEEFDGMSWMSFSAASSGQNLAQNLHCRGDPS